MLSPNSLYSFLYNICRVFISASKTNQNYFQAHNISFPNTTSALFYFFGSTKIGFGLFLKPSIFFFVKIFQFQNLKDSLFSP